MKDNAHDVKPTVAASVVVPPAVTRPAVVAPPPAKTEVKSEIVNSGNLADSLGKPAYEANCRKCHGVRGVPPKTMQAKYPKIPTFNAAFVAATSADSVVTVLTKGKNDDMKSFKDKLTHEQMVAVAAYIRGFSQ